MEIETITFKKIKNRIFLFIYNKNGKKYSYKLKNKDEELLFDLLIKITILNKYM